jgi:pimeloyl-ACP methyl ester carboxylesterase
MGSLGGLGKMANVLKVHATSLPILYIYGKRKPFMFHSEEWLQKVAAHPGSRVEGFDTGHWVMTSRSAPFHALVKEWLIADELNSVGG